MLIFFDERILLLVMAYLPNNTREEESMGHPVYSHTTVRVYEWINKAASSMYVIIMIIVCSIQDRFFLNGTYVTDVCISLSFIRPILLTFDLQSQMLVGFTQFQIFPLQQLFGLFGLSPWQ